MSAAAPALRPPSDPRPRPRPSAPAASASDAAPTPATAPSRRCDAGVWNADATANSAGKPRALRVERASRFSRLSNVDERDVDGDAIGARAPPPPPRPARRRPPAPPPPNAADASPSSTRWIIAACDQRRPAGRSAARVGRPSSWSRTCSPRNASMLQLASRVAPPHPGAAAAACAEIIRAARARRCARARPRRCPSHRPIVDDAGLCVAVAARRRRHRYIACAREHLIGDALGTGRPEPCAIVVVCVDVGLARERVPEDNQFWVPGTHPRKHTCQTAAPRTRRSCAPVSRHSKIA